MPIIKFRIVVPHHGIKKNSKGIRYRRTQNGIRPYICNTAKQMSDSDRLVAWFKKHKPIDFTLAITAQVRVCFRFFYPKNIFFTKRGTISRRLGDLSNLYCLPEDCLQKAGILENDSQIAAHDGSRRLWHDSDQHVLEIEIYEFEG